MKKFFKNKGIVVAVVVLVVAIAVAASTAVRHGRAGAVANITGQARTPVQKAVTAMVNWLEQSYSYLYRYDQLEQENEVLRAQLAEAQADVREAAELREENDRLRQLLDLAERRTDFVFESAKITARGSSNWGSSFTISKGADDGIEINDCVITEYESLVGQVVELGDNWATVRTLIDAEFEAGAYVGDGSYAGMLVGSFALMQKGTTRVTYLSEGAQMFIGDTVLTSGKGGAFPPGLMIGTITDILEEAGGQSSYGVVEPACDLDSLTQVFVIKDFQVVE